MKQLIFVVAITMSLVVTSCKKEAPTTGQSSAALIQKEEPQAESPTQSFEEVTESTEDNQDDNKTEVINPFKNDDTSLSDSPDTLNPKAPQDTTSEPTQANPFLWTTSSDTDTTIAWGQTGQSIFGLSGLATSALGQASDIAFIQYSRPNDDAGVGYSATEFLQQSVNNRYQARRLLEQDQYSQFTHRAELLTWVKKFVENKITFYEVAALSFGIAVSKQSQDIRGNKTRTVSFLSIIESSNGQYERAPINMKLFINAEISRQNLSGRFVLHYPPGVNQDSPREDRIGTLSTAATQTISLYEGYRYRAKLTLVQPPNKVYKNCYIKFSVPLGDDTSILCERNGFPPLLVMRTNLKTIAVDSFRYRKSPKDVECVASDNIGEGGLSNNALVGALFREKGICLRCHSNSQKHPIAPEQQLLCPEQAGAQTAYGNPRVPTIISHLVQNYFYHPTLDSVPKKMRDKQIDLEILKNAYCYDEKYKVLERNKTVIKSAKDVLNQWMQEYNPTHPLKQSEICQ